MIMDEEFVDLTVCIGQPSEKSTKRKRSDSGDSDIIDLSQPEHLPTKICNVQEKQMNDLDSVHVDQFYDPEANQILSPAPKNNRVICIDSASNSPDPHANIVSSPISVSIPVDEVQPSLFQKEHLQAYFSSNTPIDPEAQPNIPSSRESTPIPLLQLCCSSSITIHTNLISSLSEKLKQLPKMQLQTHFEHTIPFCGWGYWNSGSWNFHLPSFIVLSDPEHILDENFEFRAESIRASLPHECPRVIYVVHLQQMIGVESRSAIREKIEKLQIKAITRGMCEIVSVFSTEEFVDYIITATRVIQENLNKTAPLHLAHLPFFTSSSQDRQGIWIQQLQCIPRISQSRAEAIVKAGYTSLHALLREYEDPDKDTREKELLLQNHLGSEKNQRTLSSKIYQYFTSLNGIEKW